MFFIEEKKDVVTKQLTENKSSIQHNKKENKEEKKSVFKCTYLLLGEDFTGSSASLEKRKWDKVVCNNRY